MFNKITKTIICIIIFIAAFLAGYFSKEPVEKIKIVEQTKTEFKYIKEAKTPEDFKNSHYSKLEIFTKVKNNNWIEIIAKDRYKQAKKSIRIAPVIKKNFIFVNAGINDINLNYYRKIGNVMFGGGVSYPLRANVGIGYNF